MTLPPRLKAEPPFSTLPALLKVLFANSDFGMLFILSIVFLPALVIPFAAIAPRPVSAMVDPVEASSIDTKFGTKPLAFVNSCIALEFLDALLSPSG